MAGNSTVTLQDLIDDAASLGDVSPALATGGFSNAPALSIANDVMQAMINGGPAAQPFNWKWNRFNVTPFTTNSYQQDYFVPGVINLGWLESCWAVNINQTSVSKQKEQVEVRKDLEVTFDETGYPGKICWLPNNLIQTGKWGQAPLGPTASSSGGQTGAIGAGSSGTQNPGPGVVYTNPLGSISQPINATTAIKDPSGNLWALTTYGTCGSTEPNWTGTTSVTVPATAWPWDPTLSTNSAYPIAQGTSSSAGTAPVIVPVSGLTSITLSASGTVKAGVTFGLVGPAGGAYLTDPYPGTTANGTFPVTYVAGATANGPIQLLGLMGAFTDGAGKVLQPVVIGTGATLTVPNGAVNLQLGTNDNIYADNTGSFTVTVGAPNAIVYPTLQSPNTIATTIQDGTCVWTAINPAGQGFRLSPIPPQTGTVWLIQPVAQMKAARFTSVAQTLEPLPDDYATHFKQGFFAECYRRNPDPKVRAKYPMERQLFMEALDKAVRQADREEDDMGFYPGGGIMETGFGFSRVSPAMPYGPWNN
jgi:hypothetical protein